MATATLDVEYDQPVPATDERVSLLSGSFIGLTIAQALGAMNDNLFRWLIIPIGKDLWPEQEPLVLALGALMLFLPFMLLVAPAGYLSDRFSKRTVIIGAKIAEIAVMALGVMAILAGNVYLMLAVLFVMGSQSAIFGPAKYGCLPEMLRHKDVAKGNGIVLMTTMMAIIAGNVLGGYVYVKTTVAPDSPLASIYSPGTYRWWIAAVALLGVATVGTLASFWIRRLPAANPSRPFPWNPFSQTIRDLRSLISRRVLYIIALGSVFYWSVALIAQLNIDKYATEHLHVTQEYVGWLLATISVGIGVGAVFAGWISRHRIELGLSPIAALGIAIFAILLGFVAEPAATGGPYTMSFLLAAGLLLLLGLAAGLYDIPLLAYLQEHSPATCRGQILAAYNFLSFFGMSVAAGVFYLLATKRIGLTFGEWSLSMPGPGLSAAGIWIIVGLITLAVALAFAYFAILPLVVLLLRILVWTLYRPRIFGLENIPKEGGVLLVGNHVSWIDGALLYVACPRPIRYFAHAAYISAPVVSRMATMARAIRVVPGKRSVIKAMREAQRGLVQGDVVCIFPEGGLSRAGTIRAFQPGFLTILRGASRGAGDAGSAADAADASEGGPSDSVAPPDAESAANERPIQLIPFYIGGIWGSIFSYSGGKAFWKWPRPLPQPVTIAFGKPIPCPESPERLRQIVMELGVDVMRDPRRKPQLRSRWIGDVSESQPEERPTSQEPIFSRGQRMIPARAFLRMCRRNMRKLKMADTTGAEVRGADLLLRTLLFRRLLRREVLGADERFVGVLMPPSVGGVLANAALSIDGRVAVNLNYTFNSDIMNYCIERVGIRHVLTSRRVMERFDLKLDAEIVYVEELREKLTFADKLIAAAATYAVPVAVLERWLGLTRQRPDDLLTVVFTSGSTGRPKGAMLTHNNVGSNVQGFVDIMHIDRPDVVVGILPFFHAFGFTTSIWAPLVNNATAVYHYTPLEPKAISGLVAKYKGTIVPTTPTFLRNWLKRMQPEDWKTVNALICGAEKMPKDLADACEQRLGIRPWEGYGTTELSPVVSANVPPARAVTYQQSGKEGSVGQTLAGVAAKVVDLETGEDLGPNQKGMLLVKGPNVMRGYYEDPERTAAVMRGDWYVTGDIATIDDDGFIFLMGRESRMSKIGGEMVPHVLLEEAIGKVITDHRADEDDDGGPVVAVAGLPDPKRGERVVVLHTKTEKTPEDICRALREQNLPLLWIPDPRNFRQLDAIPVLGTGKLDLQGVKQKAEQLFTEDE